MIPPNFPETVAASGSESAGLPRGGPWGPSEHIPARTAAPPRSSGPRPGSAAAGEIGPAAGRSARGFGAGIRACTPAAEGYTQAQSAQAWAGLRGLGTQTLLQRTPGRPHSLPPKTSTLLPAPFPRTGGGVYSISFFKPLHRRRGPEPRASRATPRGGLCESLSCVLARVSAALCAVSFPVKAFSLSCFFLFSRSFIVFSLSLSFFPFCEWAAVSLFWREAPVSLTFVNQRRIL